MTVPSGTMKRSLDTPDDNRASTRLRTEEPTGNTQEPFSTKLHAGVDTSGLYDLGALLHSIGPVTLRRAIRKSDGARVIIKVLDNSRTQLKDARTDGSDTVRNALAEELHCAKQIPPRKALVSPIGLEVLDDSTILSFPDTGHDQLSGILEQGRMSFGAALNLAFGLASALTQLHATGYAHFSLHPHCIMYKSTGSLMDSSDTKTDANSVSDYDSNNTSRAPPAVLLFTTQSASPVRNDNRTGLVQLPDALRRPSDDAHDTAATPARLGYIAPEQTGRMRTRHGCDNRADLYSIGGVLYHAFTGEPPFAGSDDPLELVHAHLARYPAHLSDLSGFVPGPVAEIIARLLRKNPGERYQTAQGLEHDLRVCRDQFLQKGKIEAFTLCSTDQVHELKFTSKLYGRAPELRRIRDLTFKAFDGKPQLVMVSGLSGCGKTSLARKAESFVTSRGGLFLSGKQDVYNRSIPFFALASAFDQFCTTILQWEDARLTTLKMALEEALGSDAGALLELVPKLKILMPAVPPPLPLAPNAAMARFTKVVASFLRVICTQQCPIILFLDDLQWSDASMITLLSTLLTDQEFCKELPLMVLGSYRSEEVTTRDHLVNALVSKVTSTKTTGRIAEYTNIPVRDLTPRHITQMMRDLTGRDEQLCLSIGNLLYTKTGGNCFFLREMLRAMRDKRTIFVYDTVQSAWTWNVAAINAFQSSTNVLDLMVSKLNQLPDKCMEMLQCAACIGGQFSLELLSAASGLTAARLLDLLGPAIDAGLVVRVGIDQGADTEGSVDDRSASNAQAPDTYNIIFEFLHDKVQEATYKTLAATNSASRIHLNIGRQLLASCPAEFRSEIDKEAFGAVGHAQPATTPAGNGDAVPGSNKARANSNGGDTVSTVSSSRLFEIVRHLNAGVELISETSELLVLAALDDRAGKQAVAANSYDVGRAMYKAGVELIQRCYPAADVKFRLIHGFCWCTFLEGQPAKASKLCLEYLPLLKAQAHRVTMFRLMSKAQTNIPDIPAALATTVKALEEELGFKLPKSIEEARSRIRKERLQLKKCMPTTIEGILALKNSLATTDDRDVTARIGLCTYAYLPLMQAQEIGMAEYLVAQAMFDTLRHGACMYSPQALIAYGLFIAATTSVPGRASPPQYPEAAAWATVGWQLADRFDDRSESAEQLFFLSLWLRHFTRPAHESVACYLDVQTYAKKYASNMYGGFAVANSTSTAIHCGNMPLDEYQSFAHDQREVGLRFNYVDDQIFFSLLERAITTFLSKTTHKLSDWSSPDFDEGAHWQRIDNELEILNVWLIPIKMMALVFEGSYQEAQILAKYKANIFLVLPTAWYTCMYQFYTVIANLLSDTSTTDDDLGGSSNVHFKRLIEARAKSCPENFHHQHILLKAIEKHVSGDVVAALPLYDDAIKSAADGKHYHISALANQLAAEASLLLTTPHQMVLRGRYLNAALAGYVWWNCPFMIRKVNALLKSHNGQGEGGTETSNTAGDRGQQPARTTTASRTEDAPDAADLMAILKAASTISEERDLDPILSRMTQIIAEAAGAGTACIVIQEPGGGEQLQVACHAKAIGDVGEFTSVSRPGPDTVPWSLVRYTWRTQETASFSSSKTSAGDDSPRVDGGPRTGADADQEMSTAASRSYLPVVKEDSYFRGKSPRTALTMPLKYKDRALGVVYLENSLASGGAFPADRQTFLNLLLSQASISLHNALLDHETRQKEARLKLSDERYRSMLKHSPDGIWCYEFSPAISTSLDQSTQAQHIVRNSVLVDCNDTYAKRIGFSSSDAAIRAGPSIEFRHGEDQIQEDLNSWRRFVSKGHQLADEQISEISELGFTKTEYLRQATGVIEDSGLIRVWGVDRDVTEWRALQDQAKQTERLESLSRLAGGVAHDFNNMLAGILGYAELLNRDHISSDEIKEYSAGIALATQKAAVLTGNLLSFSRQGLTKENAVDVHVAISDAVRTLQRPDDPRIKIDTLCCAQKHIVKADLGQLRKALINFGTNSRDAMPHGGEFTITTSNITVDRPQLPLTPGSDFAFSRGEYILVSVSDTGSGIHPDALGHVFEPFYTTKAEGQGTGLGLAAVYGLVKELGGVITVDSTIGKGTRFDLYLPIYEDEQSSSDPMKIDTDTSSTVPAASALVMDSDPLIRKMTARRLELLGYRVVVAANGKEGWSKFGGTQEGQSWGLLMIDSSLGELSGAEVFRRVREVNKTVPVILTSGSAQTTALEDVDSETAGPLKFLAKPSSESELRAAIEELTQ